MCNKTKPMNKRYDMVYDGNLWKQKYQERWGMCSKKEPLFPHEKDTVTIPLPFHGSLFSLFSWCGLRFVSRFVLFRGFSISLLPGGSLHERLVWILLAKSQGRKIGDYRCH